MDAPLPAPRLSLPQSYVGCLRQPAPHRTCQNTRWIKSGKLVASGFGFKSIAALLQNLLREGLGWNLKITPHCSEGLSESSYVCIPFMQSDLVLWSPREYNTVADHAANAAMDEHRDWEIFDEGHIASALQSNCNLRLCVDGGRRNEAEGALGFALYSAVLGECGTYTYTLLARRGQRLNKISSAFLAEALALDWALDYLVDLLRTVT